MVWGMVFLLIFIGYYTIAILLYLSTRSGGVDWWFDDWEILDEDEEEEEFEVGPEDEFQQQKDENIYDEDEDENFYEHTPDLWYKEHSFFIRRIDPDNENVADIYNVCDEYVHHDNVFPFDFNFYVQLYSIDDFNQDINIELKSPTEKLFLRNYPLYDLEVSFDVIDYHFIKNNRYFYHIKERLF